MNNVRQVLSGIDEELFANRSKRRRYQHSSLESEKLKGVGVTQHYFLHV